MLPKPIPELTEEEFAQLQKETQRKPSKSEIELFREAKRIYEKHPL